MASENVKIKIQEIDDTTPKGAGESSDVVFIPGFSSKLDAPHITPTLCRTVKEFEDTFGEAPKRLTQLDVDPFVFLGYNAGDYDKSYIYAKELLHSGLSVVYSNVGISSSWTTDSLWSVEECCDTDVTGRVTDTQTVIEEYRSAGNSISLIRTPRESTVVPPVSLYSQSTARAYTGQLKNIRFKGRLSFNPANFAIARNTYSIFPSPELRNSSEFRDTTTVTQLRNKDFSGNYRFTVNSLQLDNVDGAEEDKFAVSLNNDSTMILIDVLQPNLNAEISVTFTADMTLELSKFVPSAVIDTRCVVIGKSDNTSELTRFYTNLSQALELVVDKSTYSVKYLTTGGYPACGTSGDYAGANLINCAAERGDAVALIDFSMEQMRSLFDLTSASLYGKIRSLYASQASTEYGAAFYPWGLYSCANTMMNVDIENMDIIMPPSFGYLMCLAKAIKTSPNWLAMAGVTRGLVPNLKSLYTSDPLTNVVAEEFQPKFGSEGHNISINAITNIRPYGLTVWGNRTLLPVDPNGTKALNFLNTRNMVSDIKKVLYTTAKTLMFEQDSDTLWLKFKSGVTPLLNQLVGGNGISDYKIIRTSTKFNGQPLTRGEMAATIKIFPLYAIEYFELTVQISDQDVTVE